MEIMKFKKTIATFIVGLIGLITVFDGYFITEEGTVDIVNRTGKIVRQTEPGLNFKIPFVESNRGIDIKTRKNYEEMPVSTSEQMPATGKVSLNWRASKDSVINIVSNYGSLDVFESNVLDPIFRDITKTTIAKYTAEDNTIKRDIVKSEITEGLKIAYKGLAVEVQNVNIEDIRFSDNYLQSINTKQTAKNLAEAEKFELEKQGLKAQQKTNTDRAEADGRLLIAKADAESIELKGKAEALAIAAKALALKSDPLVIELTKAQRWNGSYLTTGIGQGTDVLLDIRENKGN